MNEKRKGTCVVLGQGYHIPQRRKKQAREGAANHNGLKIKIMESLVKLTLFQTKCRPNINCEQHAVLKDLVQ